MAFGRIISAKIGPLGGSLTLITDLYMSFDIEKSWVDTLNKMTLKIYNLTAASASKLGAKNNICILQIGYLDEQNGTTAGIFSGQVVKSTFGRDNENKVLTLEVVDNFSYNAGGAYLTWGGALQVAVHYAKGTQLQSIYNDIIDKTAITISGITPTFTGVAANGYSDRGRYTSILGNFIRRFGYDYTITMGHFVIFQKGAHAVNTTLLLGLDSGLIKAEALNQTFVPPQFSKDWNGKKYKLTTLLFPSLNPMSLIKVNLPPSENNGVESTTPTTLIIETASMHGDNFGGEQTAVLEAHIPSNADLQAVVK